MSTMSPVDRQLTLRNLALFFVRSKEQEGNTISASRIFCPGSSKQIFCCLQHVASNPNLDLLSKLEGNADLVVQMTKQGMWVWKISPYVPLRQL